jgi:abhydrolase domain-containing protein 17
MPVRDEGASIGFDASNLLLVRSSADWPGTVKVKPNNFLKRLLYIPMVPYLSVAVFGFFFSDSLIFLPHASSYRDDAAILKLRSTNGNRISALYLANPSAQYTLLVSHGNAEDLGDDREWLSDLERGGFNVFAYDYQGYGTSEGRPSEKAAYDDEDAAYNYLTSQLKTPADRIIIFGRSVGSGPAVHIAARRPAAALILQSPFLSAFRVLTRFPILPFDKFPNYKEIGRVHCPVLVIHGTRDEVIAFRHGQKLFALANEPKQFVAVQGAGHNDLDQVAGESYVKAIQTFSSSLPAGQVPRPIR